MLCCNATSSAGTTTNHMSRVSRRPENTLFCPNPFSISALTTQPSDATVQLLDVVKIMSSSNRAAEHIDLTKRWLTTSLLACMY